MLCYHFFYRFFQILNLTYFRLKKIVNIKKNNKKKYTQFKTNNSPFTFLTTPRCDIRSDYNLCACAAASGNLDMLIWVRENGCSRCDHYVFDGAAQNGDLHIMKYMLEEVAGGCVAIFSQKSLAYRLAAANGHLQVLEYLSFLNWTWDPNVVWHGP